MNNTKENKAKLQIIISALALTVVLIAELYLMIVNPLGFTVVLVIILGAIALAMVYVLVNAVMVITCEREAQRQAHFDNLYKSEKASYIMLKNKFEEIEEKLAIIQEISKIPSEEIINAQKGIAKVIINRSKENADAIINSNDQVIERLDEMDETQNTKFTGISKDQRLKLTEMSNQTELKLQDVVVQLKDMELRLNQAIMQNGGSKVVVAAPQTSDLFVETDDSMETEDLFETEPLMVEDDFGMEDTLGLENDFALQQESPVEEEIQVEDILEEILDDIIEDAPAVEEETIVEEPIIEESVVAAPEIDLSDPNKAMSPDDIAALFASMAGGDATTEAIEPEMEEPVVEDLPPMPDLSDPNRALSPDEIAALIANL